MENMKPAKTQMAEDFRMYPSDMPAQVDEELRVKSQSLQGSLLFIAMWSRPDIAQSVLLLSSYVSNPSEKTWSALKRVLRYLKGTTHYGVGYSHNPDKLRCFKLH